MANKINIREYYESKEILSPIQYDLIKTLRNAALTRGDLVNQLNIPRTTIYDNLIKLQKRKLVEKFIKNSGKEGRPLVFWNLSIFFYFNVFNPYLRLKKANNSSLE